MQLIALCSSRGTTFQAILDAQSRGEVQSRFAGLITDRADRGCIDKAKAAGIPVRVVERKQSEPREAYDRRLDAVIAELLDDKRDDAVLTAVGWLFIFTPWFITRWHNRIINVHPALLPKFGGKGMYGHHVHDAVLAAKDRESGISIHLMDEGVDSGRILLQKSCPVSAGDTAASLQARVQELEKQWYPAVLAMLERGELSLD